MYRTLKQSFRSRGAGSRLRIFAVSEFAAACSNASERLVFHPDLAVKHGSHHHLHSNDEMGCMGRMKDITLACCTTLHDRACIYIHRTLSYITYSI